MILWQKTACSKRMSDKLTQGSGREQAKKGLGWCAQELELSLNHHRESCIHFFLHSTKGHEGLHTLPSWFLHNVYWKLVFPGTRILAIHVDVLGEGLILGVSGFLGWGQVLDIRVVRQREPSILRSRVTPGLP